MAAFGETDAAGTLDTDSDSLYNNSWGAISTKPLLFALFDYILTLLSLLLQ